MLNKKTKTILEGIVAKRNVSLSRYLYILYWDMQDWGRKKWQADGWSDITTDHLKITHLLAETDGLSNNELAMRAGVTKQAMSQMVSLLEKRGVVVISPSAADARVKLISLSAYGIEFMSYFSEVATEILKRYTDIVGKEKMQTVISVLGELTDGIVDARKNGN